MKLFDFNMILSNNKGQTKVVVEKENDLFPVGSERTVSELHLEMIGELDSLNPYPLDTTLKKRDRYYKFREEYKKKIIGAVELKHR